MLYLSRKLGESIVINNNIELKIVEVKGRSVKIGFNFPAEASVLRKEIFDSIQKENLAAAQANQSDNNSALDDFLGAFDALSTPKAPETEDENG